MVANYVIQCPFLMCRSTCTQNTHIHIIKTSLTKNTLQESWKRRHKLRQWFYSHTSCQGTLADPGLVLPPDTWPQYVSLQESTFFTLSLRWMNRCDHTLIDTWKGALNTETQVLTIWNNYGTMAHQDHTKTKTTPLIICDYEKIFNKGFVM